MYDSFHLLWRPPTRTQDRHLSSTSSTQPFIYATALPSPVISLPSLKSCLVRFATDCSVAICTYYVLKRFSNLFSYMKFFLCAVRLWIFVLNHIFTIFSARTSLFHPFVCFFRFQNAQVSMFHVIITVVLFHIGRYIVCYPHIIHLLYFPRSVLEHIFVTHVLFKRIFPVHHAKPVRSWTIPHSHLRHLFLLSFAGHDVRPQAVVVIPKSCLMCRRKLLCQ